MGGVLVTPYGRWRHLGVIIPQSVVRRWADEAGMKSAHVIGQAELLPVLVSLHLWAEELRGQRTLVFVDNDGARHGNIGVSSRSPASLPLVGAIAWECGLLGVHAWHERVPGPCNIADGPSRLDFSIVEARGSTREKLVLDDKGMHIGGRRIPWPTALRS